MPPSKPRQQPYRQRLEARMLDIAERVMTEEGLAAVQARRITTEADCSVGTLYNIFGDLDGLIVAINTRTLALFGQTAVVAVRSAAPGGLEGQLLALALAYRDFAVAHTKRWRALFEHHPAAELDKPAPFVEQRAGLLGLIASCFDGLIADEAERRCAARALYGSVHGIIILSLDNKLGGASAEETERELRFIVAMAVKGLIASKRPSGG